MDMYSLLRTSRAQDNIGNGDLKDSNELMSQSGTDKIINIKIYLTRLFNPCLPHFVHLLFDWIILMYDDALLCVPSSDFHSSLSICSVIQLPDGSKQTFTFCTKKAFSFVKHAAVTDISIPSGRGAVSSCQLSLS